MKRLTADRLSHLAYGQTFPSDVADATAKPLAAKGLTSYRCKGRYGWIMIGAKDHDDAMREAKRSSDSASRDTLQIWDGSRYVSAN